MMSTFPLKITKQAQNKSESRKTVMPIYEIIKYDSDQVPILDIPGKEFKEARSMFKKLKRVI